VPGCSFRWCSLDGINKQAVVHVEHASDSRRQQRRANSRYTREELCVILLNVSVKKRLIKKSYGGFTASGGAPGSYLATRWFPGELLLLLSMADVACL
jgi:hypothetical protein